MALIPCPNCGKEISDRAEKCPACGFEVKEKEEEKKEDLTCPECGSPLAQEAEVCPNCGCPVQKEDDQQETQKVEITKVNLKTPSKKKLIITIIVIIAIAAACLIGIKISKNNAVAEYQDRLNLATEMMLTSASKAETCAGLIHDVWYDSIFDEYDVETNPYIAGSHGDFNVAIANLFDDSDFKSDIDEILANKSAVMELMKKLSSPPDELEDAYSAIKDLYDSYLEMVNLATSPTGNLQSYTSSFNDADQDFLNRFNTMEVYTTE